MRFHRVLRAALLGCAVGLTSPAAVAQELRILEGDMRNQLAVAMNRAVVVESDTPFAELSIANPNIADISTLSDRTIYVLGRSPGRTTLTLLGENGNLLSNVEVQVTPDIAEFKERLSQILPGENIEVRTANDGIVLSGVVSSVQRLDRALDLAARYAPDRVSNLMVVGGTQQVMLKVRFAEMSRTVSKELNGGVTARIDGSDSNALVGLGSGRVTTGVDGTGTGPGGRVLDLSPTAIGQFAIGGAVGDVAISALLEALESKGLVRTLAEPNLTALSGQEASFLAGGEYPVPISQVDDDGVTVEYKPFGVQLDFVPRVVDNEVINLQINAAVSGIDNSVEVQSGGIAVNGFRRRETSTTVEMRDGESFAIAGLLQDDFRDSVAQVPFLGDLPVLGALFRSASYQREQSELVIIVTPHLVSPVRGDVLALPTDRVTPPSESDLFLRGRTVAPPRTPQEAAAAEVARQDFSGSYGYVME